MCLTCCFTDIFWSHLYLIFTKFILQMHIIAQAYLRCGGVAKTNTSRTGMVIASITRRLLIYTFIRHEDRIGLQQGLKTNRQTDKETNTTTNTSTT